jgi:hypothetical protein
MKSSSYHVLRVLGGCKYAPTLRRKKIDNSTLKYKDIPKGYYGAINRFPSTPLTGHK